MFNIKCLRLVLCFLSCYILQSSADYVTFVKLCPKGDSACLKSTAQATLPYITDGVPELGLRPADPMFIDENSYIDNNLKMIFTNNHLTGPKHAKILDMELDIDQGKYKLVVETPINITGHYDLSGKILFIEALGNGDYTLQTDRMKFTITSSFKTIEKDGHKFWKISKVDYTYDLVEKVYMNLENLFGGDNALAEPLKKLLDEQWKELIGTFGDPLIKKIMAAYTKIIDEFFQKLPVDEVAN